MKKGLIKYKKKIYYNSFFIKITRIIVPIIMYFLKTKIKKTEGKIPNKGAMLIVAHHEEVGDQFVILRYIKRKLFWVADTTSPHYSKSLVDQKFRRWLFMRLGIIPIDKKNPERNVNLFDYLLYLLSKGKAIVFFPEAYVRSERGGKKFGKFKDGVVRLALEYEKRFNNKVPIYPTGLNYVKRGNIKEASLKIGNAFFANKLEDRIELFDEIKKLC